MCIFVHFSWIPWISPVCYLEVLRIPYTSSKGLFIANILNYTQKAVTCYRSPLLQIYLLHTKKAGLHCCCSASQGSRIAYCSEQATPKPTPICTITHTPIYGVHGYGYTYPEDIKMLQCLGTILEFARFWEAKHKRIWRLIMSATTPPERHNPKAWANYGCKDTTKFADVQIF